MHLNPPCFFLSFRQDLGGGYPSMTDQTRTLYKTVSGDCHLTIASENQHPCWASGYTLSGGLAIPCSSGSRFGSSATTLILMCTKVLRGDHCPISTCIGHLSHIGWAIPSEVSGLPALEKLACPGGRLPSGLGWHRLSL